MTIEERIAFQEGVRKHWHERLVAAETGEDAQMARGWIASVERVLARLRKQQQKAA